MSTRGKTSFAHIIPRGSGAMSEHKAGGEQAGMGGDGRGWAGRGQKCVNHPPLPHFWGQEMIDQRVRISQNFPGEHAA